MNSISLETLQGTGTKSLRHLWGYQWSCFCRQSRDPRQLGVRGRHGNILFKIFIEAIGVNHKPRKNRP